jgi:hypothetical protein
VNTCIGAGGVGAARGVGAAVRRSMRACGCGRGLAWSCSRGRSCRARTATGAAAVGRVVVCAG